MTQIRRDEWEHLCLEGRMGVLCSEKMSQIFQQFTPEVFAHMPAHAVAHGIFVGRGCPSRAHNNLSTFPALVLSITVLDSEISSVNPAGDRYDSAPAISTHHWHNSPKCLLYGCFGPSRAFFTHPPKSLSFLSTTLDKHDWDKNRLITTEPAFCLPIHRVQQKPTYTNRAQSFLLCR